MGQAFFNVHNGVIEDLKETQGKVGLPRFRAHSKLELGSDAEGDFNSYAGASFFLWLIDARVQGKNYRLGQPLVLVR